MRLCASERQAFCLCVIALSFQQGSRSGSCCRCGEASGGRRCWRFPLCQLDGRGFEPGHIQPNRGAPPAVRRLSRSCSQLRLTDKVGNRWSARTISFHPVYALAAAVRSEEHTSELQSLMRISYAVFCLKKKK